MTTNKYAVIDTVQNGEMLEKDQFTTIVALLREHPELINVTEDRAGASYPGHTILDIAIENLLNPLIKELVQFKPDLTTRIDGMSVLGRMIGVSSVNAQRLIEAGANVHEPIDGLSPLVAMLEFGGYDLVACLLSHGAVITHECYEELAGYRPNAQQLEVARKIENLYKYVEDIKSFLPGKSYDEVLRFIKARDTNILAVMEGVDVLNLALDGQGNSWLHQMAKQSPEGLLDFYSKYKKITGGKELDLERPNMHGETPVTLMLALDGQGNSCLHQMAKQNPEGLLNFCSMYEGITGKKLDLERPNKHGETPVTLLTREVLPSFRLSEIPVELILQSLDAPPQASVKPIAGMVY